MAAYVNPLILDNGLQYLTDHGTHIYLCSAKPTTYAQASSTYALAVKASPTISAPGARSPSGERVVLSAITDGTVTATGTATHFAIVDGTGTALLITNSLSSSILIGAGNTFTLSSIAIGIPAP